MKPYDLRVLSLGAGLQSTTVYWMAVEGEFDPSPTLALFADTGWESQATYAHLADMETRANQPGGIPIQRVTHGNLPHDVLAAMGTSQPGQIGQPPFYVRNARNDGTTAEDHGGMLWRKCTHEYKIKPIHQAIRHQLGYAARQRVRKRVQQWFGISIDEASRMRDSRVPWIDNYYPLVNLRLSRADCRSWLLRHGYPPPPRSACIGCPYTSSTRWANLRDRHAAEWASVVDFDRRIRNGKLPGVTGDAYLHRKMLPLPEAVRTTGFNQNQIDFFEGECEGVCGI